MAKPLKCRCQSTTHNHEPGVCANDATEPDGLCKSCHDQAALEAMAAFQPLSAPKIVAATGYAAGIGTAVGVGAWLAPLPAEHSFYALVGRVASEWSHFEHILD